jgi:hypothetical protein
MTGTPHKTKTKCDEGRTGKVRTDGVNEPRIASKQGLKQLKNDKTGSDKEDKRLKARQNFDER